MVRIDIHLKKDINNSRITLIMRLVLQNIILCEHYAKMLLLEKQNLNFTISEIRLCLSNLH